MALLRMFKLNFHYSKSCIWSVTDEDSISCPLSEVEQRHEQGKTCSTGGNNVVLKKM